jgi:hypothetical protein
MTLWQTRLLFIIPKEATNLITNPSFEIDTTGFAGLNAVVARSTAQSRRGIACASVTPSANQIAFAYFSFTLAAKVYTLSMDVLDVAGQDYYVYVDMGAGGNVSSVHWTGTGYWKRRSLTFTGTANASSLSLCRSSINSTAVFYTDGWQLEEGANSTYLDGDMIGFVPGEIAYRWNGTPHASTSWRSGQTRSGGTYVDLSTYARLISIVGLGMSPIVNLAVPSSLGGSFYQNSIAINRPFSLVLNINSLTADYAVIQRARAALEAAIKPDKTTLKQPLLIQCDALDTNGLEMGETLEIPCLYEGGLEGKTEAANERFSLDFRMFMPLIKQQGEKGTALGYQTNVPNANYIVKRGSDGIWSALGTGVSAGINVYSLVSGPDGSVYASGDFTAMSGVANTVHIAKWNGSAWSAVGAGGFDGPINCMAMGADGTLYVGGGFVHDGGGAAAVYIAKWNGSVWSTVGTGVTAGGTVSALVVGPDGSLYAGGSFTQMGGVANTAYIAKWDGSTWSALGTGMNGAVLALAVGANGLYAGGTFALAGGVANTVRIAKWTGTAWVAMGTGVNNTVRAITIAQDGTVYVGGDFTAAGSVAVSHIASWNGSVWNPLGTGVNDLVYSLMNNNGLIYVGGWFTTASGITLPDHMAIWNGSTFMPLDINLGGTYFYASLINPKDNNLYLGFSSAVTGVAATVTVPNVGSAIAYPKVVFSGPGIIYQLKNYTTGKAIYFNLTLLTGEVATLNLDPQNISFNSSFRGNILGILPGSNLNFELLPGTNNISAYGSVAGSAISMTWRDQYSSIDGAVR